MEPSVNKGSESSSHILALFSKVYQSSYFWIHVFDENENTREASWANILVTRVNRSGLIFFSL